MTREQLLACLDGHPWAAQITLLETVDSTNTYARKLAAHGAPHGTVVLAEHQTGGRGRLGRSFSSPRGLGVYCSVVLRYAVPPDRLLHLTAVMAEAARRAILDSTGLETDVKWTNDLVAGKRKVCGILTELAVTPAGQTDYVICGIGVNCGQQRADFPEEIRDMASSLAMELGHPVDRARVAAALIGQLQLAAAALPDHAAVWMDGYRSHCITLGQDVKITRGDAVSYAHVDGMDDQGSLLVTRDDGSKEIVFSGEVSVRGMYGYV